MIAWVLLQQDHFEDGRFWQDALGDGTFGRGGLDRSHNVGREDTGRVREAVERFDRIDDAPLTVVLQRFHVTTLIGDHKFIEVIAEIQRVFQGDRTI